MAKPKQFTEKTKPLKTPGKYTTFYLVLLILAALGATIGAFNLLGIGQTIGYLQTNLPFGLLNIALHIVNLAFIAAVILLFMKKRLGLYTIISCYGLTIICMIALVPTAQPLILEIAREVVNESQNALSPDAAETIVTSVFIVIAIANSAVSILFAALWAVAFTRQERRDVVITQNAKSS